MAHVEVLARLQKETKCPICLDDLTDPVTVECGHNFCRSCIKDFWAGQQATSSCPVCRHQCQHRNLRSNAQLGNMIETAQLLQGMENKRHESSTSCERHNQALTLFCEDDLQLLCDQCVEPESHGRHQVLSITEAASLHRKHLQDYSKLLKWEVKEIQGLMSALNKRTVTLREQAEAQRSQLTSECEKLMRFLDQAVFPAIAQEIGREELCRPAGKDLMRKLEKHLTAEKGPMIVLVLDEMDQLDSKGQDVLYTLFEWPWLSNSRLVLIGIANTLDLTDRILPRLEARENCKPQLLNFPPYTRNQIAAILQDRLSQVSKDQVLDSAAIQFCARKVSAVSGDIRKALDVCRRAIEIVESDVRSQTVLKPLSECKSPSESPVPKRVGLAHISQVISEVDGNRVTLSQENTQDSLPLQQKILVCSLLLLTRRLKIKEVTLGKLYEAYSSICRKQQVTAVDQSECLSLSGLLESRGLVGLKKNKESRLTKVSLKIEEKEIEHVLNGKAFTGNILAAGLP